MANKFAMNLDHFKKIKSDDHSTTLKHMKDNHEIRVAHKALSNAQKEKLSKLEMYADGGEVEDDSFFSPERITQMTKSKPYEVPVEEPKDPNAPLINFAKESFEDITPEAAKVPEQAGQPLKGPLLADTNLETAGNILAEQTAPQAKPADMQMPQQYGQSQLAGLEEQGKGLEQQARAQGQLGLQQAKAQEEHQARMQQNLDVYQQKRADLEADGAKMQQEIMDGHLDPNRFINDMSTGGRINTAIGLILGGMGAGLTHGPNLAYNFLQKQIDEDIGAQKTEMGKKENLLRHNYQQLGNLDSAYDKTRLQMNDMLLAKLSQMEGTAKNQVALGQIQNIKGMIQAKQGELLDSTAKRQAFADIAASGDPQQIVSALDAINPDQAEKLRGRMVPGMGFANTPADATKMKELNADATSARKIIHRLKEINSTTGKSINPEIRAEAFNLSRTLVGQLNRAFTGGGPMSAQEQELLSEIARNPTAIMSLESSNKKSLDTLEKTLNNKIGAVAQSIGLKTPQFPSGDKQQPGQKYEMRVINGQKMMVPKGQ